MHTTIPNGYPNSGAAQQPGETNYELCNINLCDSGYDTEGQAGRFGASATADACVRCPAGRYAVNRGTGSCSLCPAGKFMHNIYHTQVDDSKCKWCGQTLDDSNYWSYPGSAAADGVNGHDANQAACFCDKSVLSGIFFN